MRHCVVMGLKTKFDRQSYCLFIIYFRYIINSLPNNKIVVWSNLKASANDKIYVAEKLKFVLGKVENIKRNGENAMYVFKRFFLQGR